VSQTEESDQRGVVPIRRTSSRRRSRGDLRFPQPIDVRSRTRCAPVILRMDQRRASLSAEGVIVPVLARPSALSTFFQEPTDNGHGYDNLPLLRNDGLSRLATMPEMRCPRQGQPSGVVVHRSRDGMLGRSPSCSSTKRQKGTRCWAENAEEPGAARSRLADARLSASRPRRDTRNGLE
jgi:hypothetical protein